MLTPRWTPLRPHDEQIRLFESQARFKVVAAGRRSGKTEIVKRIFAEAVIAASKPWSARYFLGAPTRQQAKAIFWQDMKALVPKELISGKPSETELSIRTITGNYLQVVGLNEPARIEGTPWDGCGIDEFANVPPEAWTANIRPALSDRRGFAYLFGVPEGRNHYYQIAELARSGVDPDWDFFTWPSADILSPEEIASAKRDLDEFTFSQEYEASFNLPSAQVYYAFSDDNIRAPEAVGDRLCAGMDFNVVPYLPAVVFSVLSNGVVHFVDEIILPAGIRSNTPEMIRELKARYPQIREVYPDPAGRQRSTSAVVGTSDHDLLREAGYDVISRPRTKSVKNRIAALNRKFRSAAGEVTCYVSPKCKRLIEAFRNHVRDEKTGKPQEDQYVHLCDAACYPIDYLFPIEQQRDWDIG